MCERKIKTIEAIFFLFLFSVIVLLLPQDAHARVRVVTKGTTSTIRDTDGVIEDESSSDYDTSDTDTSDSDDGTEDDTEFDYPTEEETFPSDYADTGDYTGTDVYTDNNWQ